jgi:hypothetical protein
MMMMIIIIIIKVYTFRSIPFLYSRGAKAVHSAQCAMMCAAVPCARARDGTARPGM